MTRRFNNWQMGVSGHKGRQAARMRRFRRAGMFLSLAIGIIILIPLSLKTFAAVNNNDQTPPPVNYLNVIHDPAHGIEVYVFMDGLNRCYVLEDLGSAGISCLPPPQITLP